MDIKLWIPALAITFIAVGCKGKSADQAGNKASVPTRKAADNPVETVATDKKPQKIQDQKPTDQKPPASISESAQGIAATKVAKLKSEKIAFGLEQSINNFYVEYGALPDVGATVRTDSENGKQLLNILLGLEEGTDKVQNTRQIKFLNIDTAKNKLNGLVLDAAGQPAIGLVDAWGNPFTVVLDTMYEERLHFTIGSQPVNLNGRRAAVYSDGADKTPGTADDIKSW